MFCPEGACPFRDQCDRRTFRAALVYGALGYEVYPASPYSQAHVSTLGRFPRGEGGFKIASKDYDKIVEWGPQWDSAATNIGIATGARSRLVVIDIDARPIPMDTSSGSVRFSATVAVDPEPANRVRKWMEQKQLVLPGNVIVATPSGGTHVWLRLPEGWTIYEVPRKLGWLEDVDLLWDRHSIKAPPSMKLATERKPGGEYRFTRGCPCEVPEASEDLLSHLAHSETFGRVSVQTDDGLSERLDVDGMLHEGIPVGQQNDGLHRLACSFAAQGKPPSDALAALAATISVSPVGDPTWPWTLDDLADLVGRAYHFIAENRGGYTALASKIRM